MLVFWLFDCFCLSFHVKRGISKRSGSFFPITSEEEASHGDCPPEEARSVTFKKPSSNTLLGINVVGGNATGIFVSDIEKDSLAATLGSLRIGDRILQVKRLRSS